MEYTRARELANQMREQLDMEREEHYMIKYESPISRGFEYPDPLWSSQRLHRNPDTGEVWNARYLYKKIVRDGIRVHAQVRWDVPYATEKHPHEDPTNAMLGIFFQPVAGEYFPYRVPKNPLEEQHGWHLSLIHSKEFDECWPGEFERIMTHLIVRYHDQILHLKFREPIPEEEGTMDDATGLQFARDDPIASDWVVQELRKTDNNRHKNRSLHITI